MKTRQEDVDVSSEAYRQVGKVVIIHVQKCIDGGGAMSIRDGQGCPDFVPAQLDPNLESSILLPVRIIAKRTLKGFWESAPEYADAKGPLEAWYFEVIRASWATPQELKAQFGSASILKNNRVVFNIAGNKYRLVVAIDYRRQACFVKFIGAHKQYDTIDAETCDGYSTHKK